MASTGLYGGCNHTFENQARHTNWPTEGWTESTREEETGMYNPSLFPFTALTPTPDDRPVLQVHKFPLIS